MYKFSDWIVAMHEPVPLTLMMQRLKNRTGAICAAYLAVHEIVLNKRLL